MTTIPTRQKSPRVVIVGGGLAGMAAAVALQSAGVSVTLIEARKSLGGRAGSFEDPSTGETLDNCQHVLLGCCTNLIDFYRRIGAGDRIRWESAIRFADPDGRTYALSATALLPAPMHLAPAMAGFGLLSIGERMAVSRAVLAMLRLGRTGRQQLGDVAFADWLDQHHQPAGAIQKLYDPVIVSGLNEETRRASAAYAIKIFQDALLAHRRAYLMGVPNCPLSHLYERLPIADLRLGTRVGEIRYRDGAAIGVTLQNGEAIDADAVVLATNYHALEKWVPPELAQQDSRFSRLGELQSVPILGVHLWFDRPVLPYSHLALVEGPLQWLFRKDGTGTALHGVISAARNWVGVPREEALPQFEAQVRKVLPAAKEAKLQRGVVVVEKRATFAALPGVDRLRPSQAPPPGGIARLVLAGDFTLTGWPATMEGAVRSGYLAAEAVLAAIGSSYVTRILVPDLPVARGARIMGM